MDPSTFSELAMVTAIRAMGILSTLALLGAALGGHAGGRTAPVGRPTSPTRER